VATDLTYRSDTLRWVAADVRYPPGLALANALPEALQSHLHERFPILEAAPALTMTVSVAGGPAASPQPSILHRLLERERLMSFTVGRDGVTLETTSYPGWDVFSGILADVIGAIERDIGPDGISRVGLRYIDEVRIPEPPDTFRGWRGWVNDRLVQPFEIELDQPLSQATLVLQYGTAPGFVTVFRASPLENGRVVQEQGPLRQPYQTPDGPYFLLDTDSSWMDPERRIPAFDTDAVMTVFGQLHAAGHRLYEEAIGPRLRQEVLARTPEELWGAES
jgi:uncharacterized protein (TIGR04255 family)